MEPDERQLPRLVLVPVVVLCALVGLALAVLGWSGWLLGAGVLVLGLVGRSTGARWAGWAVPIGVGLVLGTLVYLLVLAVGPAPSGSTDLSPPRQVSAAGPPWGHSVGRRP